MLNTMQFPLDKTSRPQGKIEALLDWHDDVRLNSINLIVSENRMSKKACAPLSSDLHARYAADFYAGTEPAQEIIVTVTELAKKAFKADFANLSPISGYMALLSAVFALTENQDYFGRIPPFFPGGGYPLDYDVFDRKPLPLPFSETNWQVDLPKTLALLSEKKPPLVVLGSSIVTYPMPIREIAEVVHAYGGIIAYDGSHTLGLILGGQYQDPLREGADLLLGSTHKTLPGPQGGIIVTNSEAIHKRINNLSNFTPLNGPTLICNPHLARIASTGIVLEETNWQEYAEQVVLNARTIARVFKKEGIPMHGANAINFREATYCHQVITNYSREESITLRDKLQKHRINVDGFLRIGTSEITRLGFKQAECEQLARIMAYLLKTKDINTNIVDKKINLLINKYREVVL
jgi:glycine hydroxymethyltransferase